LTKDRKLEQKKIIKKLTPKKNNKQIKKTDKQNKTETESNKTHYSQLKRNLNFTSRTSFFYITELYMQRNETI